MKDYSYHKKVIEDVTVKLNELGIDLYLIITAEGCDPMTSFIPGVDTVGSALSCLPRTAEGLPLHPVLTLRMWRSQAFLMR